MRAWRLGDFQPDPDRQCGFTFPNPNPDINSPVHEYVCTCRARHNGPHVAHHPGDLWLDAWPIAVCLDEPDPCDKASQEPALPDRMVTL